VLYRRDGECNEGQGGASLVTEFVDRQLVCRECGKGFVFSAGEQQFFHAKGLQHEPGRCPECRAAQKARLSPLPERPAREYFTAVCAACGGPALLPFQPRNDRPVYCSSCYDRVREADSSPAPNSTVAVG
jgi:CxxC-x17-CxxC domain-containing protein